MKLINAITVFYAMLSVLALNASEPVFSGNAAGGEISVNYKGQPLISGDASSHLQPGFSSGKIKIFNQENIEVTHISGLEKQLEFFKEIGVSNDRIELTLWARTLPGSSGKFEYWLNVPVEFLKGCKYQALVGRCSDSRWSSGQFTGTEEDKTILEKILFLAIEAPGKNVYIDFNPCGPLNEYGSFSGTWGNSWNIRRKGNFYLMTFTMFGKSWGNSENLKVIIGKGSASDFKLIHPVQKKNYTESIAIKYFISFGDKSAGGSIPCKQGVFSESKGFGWCKNYQDLAMHNSGFEGQICKQYITGPENAEFKFKVNPGRYILSLTFGDSNKPLGPFDVFINGEKNVSGVISNPGEYLSIPLIAIANSNELLLSFKGKWAISSLILQPFLFNTEDYLWLRNWWLICDDAPALSKISTQR